ncbi:hypothetical protein E2C01_074438 [Portunus trituberculatus]|uniref:Uncharacterized protein n=1 Tax=Portunus trituberculatus TaxID=210409 RepID=A0A5B7IH89_PORTR|nr:hypothetical protein [Portunus trituberculatus]
MEGSGVCGTGHVVLAWDGGQKYWKRYDALARRDNARRGEARRGEARTQAGTERRVNGGEKRRHDCNITHETPPHIAVTRVTKGP